jgi:surfeit locus 1 family protein
MPLRELMLPTVCTIVAFAMLAGLGIWQIKRLQWKQDLITRIETRAAAQPIALAQAMGRKEAGDDVRHARVVLEGRFQHEGEVHLYSLAGGRAGWRIITPMALSGGGVVLVDRGFVPHRLKQAGTRSEGQVEGMVRVVGRIRLPQRRDAFAADNDPQKNEWFWRDLDAMAGAALGDTQSQSLVPLIVELEATDVAGGWPRGGVAVVKPSNRHLGYAITWFALAVIVLIIYGIFVRNTLKRA